MERRLSTVLESRSLWLEDLTTAQLTSLLALHTRIYFCHVHAVAAHVAYFVKWHLRVIREQSSNKSIQ